MSCSPSAFKTFLVCSNVALLFIGVSILILAVKMYLALTAIFLINISLVSKTVQAVISVGFFISVAGTTGICGACYESLWLLLVHLVSLGVIVIMEFVLGVTLMVVKRTIENAIENVNCNDLCIAAVDTIVLDYALPSAGLMMTIIIVEALMIYCSIRMYFYIRDRPKAIGGPAGPSVIVQNVQMRNVSTLNPVVQQMYAHHLEYMEQPNPQSQYTASSTGQEDEFLNPPDYVSLQQHQQIQQQSEPPAYADAFPLPNPVSVNTASPFGGLSNYTNLAV